MLNFKTIYDPVTDSEYIETNITGKNLLTIPQLNKGTAFTAEERQEFGLLGKLPHRIETIEEQATRAYLQYSSYTQNLHRHIYLNNLHDKNQILFYYLVTEHLDEMLPIIYTPVVGTAVQFFSREYRQPRGLYISHFDQDQIDLVLNNRSDPDVDLIVVTDGEGVLGIGDQGIGGMDIPVAKLMVYSLCGGINPTKTLPVFLDVGTNNPALLTDPLYLGCRHQRLNTEEYDSFINKFVERVKHNFPNAFLHWEDFGRNNARRILDRFQDELCTFNDDIQGTGAVALAAIISACNVTRIPFIEQRIILFGAGSAGTGICDQIIDAMEQAGLSREEAYTKFWLIDRDGLLVDDNPALTDAQKPFARKSKERSEFSLVPDPTNISLLDTVKCIKPTILIGCSAQSGAFTQEIVEAMAENCKQPIIFPLSNPDEKCEAKPQDLVTWTNGSAIIATGTGFPDVESPSGPIKIAQCNNALIFPGVGLGIIAVKAKRLSKSMLFIATQALTHLSPSKINPSLPLLPSLNNAKIVAKYIARFVAEAAIAEGLATCNQDKDMASYLEELFWQPDYLPFKKPKNE